MIKVKTYPEVLEDMLALFDDKYDKRQGSVLYNLVAPAAREVAIQYTVLKSYEEVNFLDTSTGIFLTRLCSSSELNACQPRHQSDWFSSNRKSHLEPAFSVG